MPARLPASFRPAILPALCLLALCACAALPAAANAAALTKYIQAADNFIILFDTSGSMAAEYPPSRTSKLYAATDLLRAVNADIPEFPYKAALLTFTPWKEYYPLQTYDKAAFARAIESLPTSVPGGAAFGPPTPLGEALRGVGRMLKELSGRTVVFIFSDGRNTDRWNPVKIARELGARHDVCFMVVDMSRYPEGRNMLKGIATATPCSVSMDFDYAVRNPEVCTGQLCALTPFSEIIIVQEDRYVPVQSVWFDLGKAELKAWARQMLDKAAAEMKRDPGAVFYGAGFTCTRGADAFNVQLSMRRALAAKDYLVREHGIDPGRIVVRWFGESAPAAPNDTEAGRRLNRRLEYLVMPGR